MEPATSLEPSWLDLFAANPTGELSALLAGYARIFPLDRLEPSTILIEQFGTLPEADPLRARLDGAILELLGRFRRATPEQAERHGTARLIQQANEMFLAAGRLRLPQVLAAVGRDFNGWSAWAKRLRLADYRDARLGLWRMVARNQDLAGLGRSLAAHWINLCGEVGVGHLSRAYLPVAFDGLHDLPPRDGAVDSIDDLLTGVARWARHLARDRQEDFLVVWAGLSGRLGLTPSDIQGRVTDILSNPSLAALPFAGWWRTALGMGPGVVKKGRDVFPSNTHGWKEATTQLIAKVRPLTFLPPDIKSEIERFIGGSEAYADQIADNYALSRNMNRLGTALLSLDPHLTLKMVQSSLDRDPGDAHQYGLWARALMALGRGAAAVKVLWQGIAIDPGDVHRRTQLSDALTGLGRVAEAEALYRDTMRLFPDNAHCRTTLAALLAERGQVAEAEALYRDTMRLFPDNAHCRTALAALLAAQGRVEEAEALYRDSMRLFPDNAPSRNALAALLAAQGRVGEALDLYRQTVAVFTNDPVCRLDLGLLLLRRGPNADEVAEVQRLLDALRRMRDTGANTLSHHLDRHLRGLPFQSGSGAVPQSSQVMLEPGELPDTLLIAAAAREAQFRLGGALDNPALLLLKDEERDRLKQEAVNSLNRLLKTDPGHPLLLLLSRRYAGLVSGLQSVADGDIRLAAVHDPVTAIAARRFGLIQPRDYSAVRQQWPDHAHLADAAELLDLGPSAKAAAARLAALASDWQKSDKQAKQNARPWDARLAGEFARLLTTRKLDVTADNLLALVDANTDGLDELLDLCLMAGVEMLPERSLLLAA
ncbi:tetratricopeptide repeat protein [Asticcacaulis sp.]|uniref:tetratricopeptide repeat protein n=1 Tax=Asticcacaulis sp. TaxID=1872648 RepID=UPI0026124566|nr:tetratricopeptide repeat protein [Asticcacaulis sp.]